MGKIFYIMGKSASGKDHVYRRILDETTFPLKELVICTTRPIRQGETEGKEYYFVDAARLRELREEGKIIEERTYHTIHGPWTYFTADDGNIDLEQYNYLGIGTLESYEKLRKYYGKDKIVPIYIEVDDGIRLERALKRERKPENQKYKEMCRRFLADCEDFSEENINKVEITRRFSNNGTFEECMKEVEDFIQSVLY